MTQTPRARERTEKKQPDWVRIDPITGAATIQLAVPIIVGGIATNSVTMRRPKVRDRLDASKAPGSAEAIETALFANLMDYAPEEIHEMDLADYGRCSQVFRDFLSSPMQRTSEEASS